MHSVIVFGIYWSQIFNIMRIFGKFLSAFIYFEITRPSNLTDIDPGRTILCFEISTEHKKKFEVH